MRGYFYILDARWYNRSMNNDIVQLTDKSGNNIYPIAGGATQDSISKSMLAEGVFEGPELFPSPNEAYVRTANIVDGAVTSDKIDWATLEPTNYAADATISLGSYNSNTQQMLLYPNGDVIINITINTANALTADTPYDVCYLPSALKIKSNKNITFMGQSYRNGLVFAYYQGNTGKIIARPAVNIASGGEISIVSTYNINQ